MDPMQANQQALAGRKSKVKNRAAADVQVTAEQILVEARAHQEQPAKPPQQHVMDTEELAEFRTKRRKEFEDKIRMRSGHVGTYIQYAQWEESQYEIERARSIYERALNVDYTETKTWLKYVQMEMRNKFINRARNVFDRVVTLLPRVDQFWYKYTYMEEMVGNINNARQVFERWMQWHPDDQAWLSYAKLEMRQGEVARARKIYERYVACHSTVTAFLRYSRWEERQGQLALARRVYERAVDELGDDGVDEELFLAFASFEERSREFERARAIYKQGIDVLPNDASGELYKAYVAFEKKHGEREDVEDVVVRKRREQYELAISEDPLNYDTWFDYIRLEEGEGGNNPARVREIYERAVANLPPVEEKRYWKRYIYLWINYAVYEELNAKDYERCQQVYDQMIKVIPHEKFTFSKVWILAAQFAIRRKNLQLARRVFGKSLAVAPREKVIKKYIDIEYQLGEIDRCRKLYEKYIQIFPQKSHAWSKFADLESAVGETERARAIYELGVSQEALEVPELLWKNYIDFEIMQQEWKRVRNLYERLLDRSKHVKVWTSYANFEADHVEDNDAAREVYRRGNEYFQQAIKTAKSESENEAMRNQATPSTVSAQSSAGQSNDDWVLDLKEQRVMLLESWRKFELSLGAGNSDRVKEVTDQMPKRVKRKRQVYSSDGVTPAGWEEYYDYVFPEENKAAGSMKILQMAQMWKKGKMNAASGDGASHNGGAADSQQQSVGSKRKAEESDHSEEPDNKKQASAAATDENELDIDA
eukprot:gb/GECG01004113.1/.p1 GENE.gb/GECG01004113.1/~~gb/GECG01004113.1/.p1  ORF type:complete len:766 (+),score=139.72 gb/GECG01004113.1/:1-2298(+)